ncbi:MAG: TIGR04282 family arsenosugar biosynthesis glycosyltransferase [Sandaracinaceae bacterium]
MKLGIFLRAPRAGATKTRLAQRIGDEAAAALARAFAEDLVARLAGHAALTLFVAGAIDDPFVRDIAARFALPVESQLEGGLGARMTHALRVLGARGDEAALLGADVPTCPAWMVAALRGGLSRADVALSPAPDGGYVAIASRGGLDPSFLEAPIRYSSAHACADTMLAAREAGLTATCVTPWYDVDVAADLRVLRAELGRDPRRAPRTAAVLARLDQRSSEGGASAATGPVASGG